MWVSTGNILIQGRDSREKLVLRKFKEQCDTAEALPRVVSREQQEAELRREAMDDMRVVNKTLNSLSELIKGLGDSVQMLLNDNKLHRQETADLRESVDKLIVSTQKIFSWTEMSGREAATLKGRVDTLDHLSNVMDTRVDKHE